MAQASDPGPGKPKVLSGVACRSYNVASVWEETARLTDEQEAAVELVRQACAQRPYPSHVSSRTLLVVQTRRFVRPGGVARVPPAPLVGVQTQARAQLRSGMATKIAIHIFVGRGIMGCPLT